MRKNYILFLALCLIYGSGFSQSTNLYPPLNLQAFLLGNEVQLSWEAPEDTTSITMLVPEGLIGYRVYGNNNIIGSTEDSILTFIDTNPDAVVNYYKVTALYDMAFYGFPGDTAESAPSNLAFTVNETLVHLLPFTENFTTGVFSTNQWTSEPNWKIAGQSGNPAPCVEFSSSPTITNYSRSLTSNWLYIQPFIAGDVYLSFDLKQQTVYTAGTEELIVEVFDGYEWHAIFTITNTESTTWKDYKIPITNLANGKPFKFRFRAEGENSINITNWRIDNTAVYRECAAPVEIYTYIPNLNDLCTAYVEWNLNYTYPWADWDNGTNSNSFGLNNAGTFSAAIRFTPYDLNYYHSYTHLKKIKFFPTEPGCTVIIKVWKGPNASTLLYSQPLDSYLPNSWNEIELETPIEIDKTSELWFGYTFTHAEGQSPAGTDSGPAVVGRGNMISTDNETSWNAISTLGHNFNWNISGLLIDSLYKTISVLPTSYNVFREDILIANTTKNEYLDDLSDIFSYPICYTVKSVYQDCESDFSPMDCIIIAKCTSNAENNELPTIELFPNPTAGLLNVTCSSNIRRLMLFDIMGRVMGEFPVNQESLSISLDLRKHPAGIYNLKFESSDGAVQFRKIIVTR